MIITRLFGGLGNQMFQYAAGLALAGQHGVPLRLDVSSFDDPAHPEAHNRYALDGFNVAEPFATGDEVAAFTRSRFNLFGRVCLDATGWLGLRSVQQRIDDLKRSRAHRSVLGKWGRRTMFSAGSRWHVPPTVPFYPGFPALGPSVYLDGLFQSERFFAPVADRLRLRFTYLHSPPPAVAEIAARIKNDGPSASVHFRRGDYVANETYRQLLGPVGPDYYRRAVALLRETHPAAVLYIFSDDLDAVQREFQPDGPHHFVRAAESWPAHETLRLMGLCGHQIIANSTFSWWGAWLNPSPAKIVIAPQPWFSDRRVDGGDVVPTSWRLLER